MKKIKDMMKNDRPIEKLIALGVRNLSIPELLAILIGSGNNEANVLTLAQMIYQDLLIHDRQEIYNFDLLNWPNLKNFKGIGTVKSSRILAGIELGRRIALYQPIKDLPLLNRPELVAAEVNPLLNGLDHEEVYAIYLNIKNRLIYKQRVATGSLAQCVIEPREIFKPAITNNAAGLIIVHNHPSGELQPSMADLKTTKEYAKLGKALKIWVHDHIIIGNNDFLSLRSEHPELFI